jgi:branched-chain amino acid aminotransferase
MNGEFVPYEDAKVHVLTHALHYGTGVFEGVRAYETPRGTAIFRHQDHIEPAASARPACTTWTSRTPRRRSAPRRTEVIARSGFKSCYIRPLVYRGAGPMGLYPLDCPVDVCIAVWEWGAYLGDEGKLNGVRAKVSSWRKIPHDAQHPDREGHRPVPSTPCSPRSSPRRPATRRASCSTRTATSCEGTGENLFVIRDGVIATPGYEASILGGINRLSAIQIAKDLGYEVCRSARSPATSSTSPTRSS